MTTTLQPILHTNVKTISLKLKKKKLIIPLIRTPQYLMYSQGPIRFHMFCPSSFLWDLISHHSLLTPSWSVWPLRACWTWLPNTSLRNFRLFPLPEIVFPKICIQVTSSLLLVIHLYISLATPFSAPYLNFIPSPSPSIIPQHCPFLFCFSLTHRVVPSYPQGSHSKTPTGCLKPWIIPSPI